jgi:hypothetical protein
MDALKIDCTLHGLRHTHVSQLIAAGLDVLTISRRIGHASPAITLNVYSHMFSNTDARAAEIMAATFANVRSTEWERTCYRLGGNPVATDFGSRPKYLKTLEATTRIELVYTVLQTVA